MGGGGLVLAHVNIPPPRSRPGCHVVSTSRAIHPRGAFQSQTRSRPGCHPACLPGSAHCLVLSISNEKPPRLPPCLPAWQRSLSRCFNLKREAAPVATPQCHDLRQAIEHVSISNEKPP